MTEFKITDLKTLNKIQENSQNFNELWKKVNKQKEYYTKRLKLF